MRGRIEGRDLVLVLGATMRLTRLVTNDDLGQWWIRDPLDAWVHRHPKGSTMADLQDRYDEIMAERARLVPLVQADGADPDDLPFPEPPPAPARLRYHRYVAGLECPHCVGTWIGAGVVASLLLARRHPAAHRAWRVVAGVLALNTAAVAAGDMIDYWD